MQKWIIRNEEGITVGLSAGNDREEAFFHYLNGDLLLTDEWRSFEEITDDEAQRIIASDIDLEYFI